MRPFVALLLVILLSTAVLAAEPTQDELIAAFTAEPTVASFNQIQQPTSDMLARLTAQYGGTPGDAFQHLLATDRDEALGYLVDKVQLTTDPGALEAAHTVLANGFSNTEGLSEKETALIEKYCAATGRSCTVGQTTSFTLTQEGDTQWFRFDDIAVQTRPESWLNYGYDGGSLTVYGNKDINWETQVKTTGGLYAIGAAGADPITVIDDAGTTTLTVPTGGTVNMGTSTYTEESSRLGAITFKDGQLASATGGWLADRPFSDREPHQFYTLDTGDVEVRYQEDNIVLAGSQLVIDARKALTGTSWQEVRVLGTIDSAVFGPQGITQAEIGAHSMTEIYTSQPEDDTQNRNIRTELRSTTSLRVNYDSGPVTFDMLRKSDEPTAYNTPDGVILTGKGSMTTTAQTSLREDATDPFITRKRTAEPKELWSADATSLTDATVIAADRDKPGMAVQTLDPATTGQLATIDTPDIKAAIKRDGGDHILFVPPVLQPGRYFALRTVEPYAQDIFNSPFEDELVMKNKQAVLGHRDSDGVTLIPVITTPNVPFQDLAFTTTPTAFADAKTRLASGEKFDDVALSVLNDKTTSLSDIGFRSTQETLLASVAQKLQTQNIDPAGLDTLTATIQSAFPNYGSGVSDADIQSGMTRVVDQLPVQFTDAERQALIDRAQYVLKNKHYDEAAAQTANGPLTKPLTDIFKSYDSVNFIQEVAVPSVIQQLLLMSPSYTPKPQSTTAALLSKLRP